VAAAVLAALLDLATARASPLTPASPQARLTSDLFWITLGIAMLVLLAVEFLIVYTSLRFRPRRGLAPTAEPPQIHGNTRVEIVWTTIPAIILAIIFVPSVKAIFESQAPAPANALDVIVTGHQFWWEFEYPSLGVRTANELHVPIGQPTNLELRSADVIHSFYIPVLGGHRDANPGQVPNYIWFTAKDAHGNYPGQCVELCGYSHANMRARAILEDQGTFNNWVQAQALPAAPPADPTAAQGAQLVQTRGCAGCHSIGGTAAQARVGPDLTHFASRGYFAGAMFERTDANLRAWLANPPGVKPGATMPNLGLNADDITAIIAYLDSLQ
jgi:cytochrome c oxidase subunit 2